MTPNQPAMRTDWQVRLADDPVPRSVPTPEGVLEGVRDGEWEPSDEVRGPGDRLWRPVEDHPTFADAIAEMGPPPAEPEDETRLDMNPLIDVALVLLIFFIITATYTTLRRTIDVPAPQQEGESRQVTAESLQDRTFTVTVTLDDQEKPQPVVAINDRVILFDDIDKEVDKVVKETGRKEMFLKMWDAVTWETEVKVRSAAANAGVHMIHMLDKKK